MYIDTNREPEDYQDDHYVDVNPGYIKAQIYELEEERYCHRLSKTWTWDRERDYRIQIIELEELL